MLVFARILKWGFSVARPDQLSRLFKVLSVGTRVRIVQILKQKALCVNALASRLDISAAAVSQHLRILHDAELVNSDKDGYYVHYSLNKQTLKKWKNLTEELLGTTQKSKEASAR